MADDMFPIQDGPSIPWAYMAPHEAQARKNHGQTLEGLAKRGGLGCAEAWVIVHGLKHIDILPEEHKCKWIELAERVNREWSTKQARAEVLAACIKHFETEAEGCADYANEETGETRAAWNREEERYQNCADDLRKLQPAAKALEGLLREKIRGMSLEEIAKIKGVPALARVGKRYDRPDFTCVEDE